MQVSDGNVATAPEEKEVTGEIKELFAIPKSNRQKYLAGVKQMMNPDLHLEAATETAEAMHSSDAKYSSTRRAGLSTTSSSARIRVLI